MVLHQSPNKAGKTTNQKDLLETCFSFKKHSKNQDRETQKRSICIGKKPKSNMLAKTLAIKHEPCNYNEGNLVDFFEKKLSN